MSVKNRDNLSISPWIRRFCHLLPKGGSVLDLAAGGGRHTLWCLQRGHQVTALDREIGDLERLKADFDACAMDDAGARSKLEIVQADLEDGSSWPLGARRFEAVLVVNYLHRPLFPDLLRALAPGGVLLYDTFAVGQEALGRPSNPDFLLKPGELLHHVRDHLQIAAYEHGRIEGESGPAIKQRLAAVFASEPAPLR